MAAPAQSAIKQATFIWQGQNAKGKTKKGEISGINSAMVKAQLRKQGIKPTKVKKKGKDLFSASKPAIKPMDIAIFTRQLATMMKAGIPLVQSFEIVGEGLENASMKEIVFSIRDDVSAGSHFADAIRKFPRQFDELFCNLIQSGEQSGALETMLFEVAEFHEGELDFELSRMMTWIEPIFIILIGLILGGVVIALYLPIFQMAGAV